MIFPRKGSKLNDLCDKAQDAVFHVVTNIQDIIDGTCIIMIIKNGQIGIRTTRTFDASGKYDSDKLYNFIYTLKW